MATKVGVGYVRVSSSQQAEEGHSLEHQHNKITKYCIDNGIELLDIHEDAGRSGYHVDSKRMRPGLILLLDAIKNKKITHIIVTKNDRLGRDQEEKAFIKRQCIKNKVEIVYIDQPGLSGAASTPTEKLIDSLMDLLDEFYSMNLGMEVMKIHQDLARKGLYTGGRVPIGYKLQERLNDNGKTEKILVIDEETAPVVRLIYSMYLNGNGTHKISQHLNTIKAAGKNIWTTTHVSTILKNPNYYTRVWNRNESRKVNGYTKPQAEWIYATEEHETIISEADWMQVQENMKRRNKNPNKSEQENQESGHDSRYYGKYMLTGMITCGRCGKTYAANRSTSSRSKTVGYYFQCPSNRHSTTDDKCSNNLNMQKLDMVVWEELCKFLTPQEINKEINKTLEMEADKNKLHNQKFKDIQLQINEHEKKLNNFIKIIGDMDLTDEHNMQLLPIYNSKISELKNEIDDLKGRLIRMGEPLPEEVMFPFDLDIVEKEYLVNPDYLNYLDIEVVRAIVHTLVKEIIATKIDKKHTELEIIFRFNHPTIKEVYNFRKKNMKQTKKVVGSAESKEFLNSFTRFLSDLYLGIGNGAPSPFFQQSSWAVMNGL